MEEIWRTVIYNGETYENYEVSNYGRVRSLNYNHTGEVRLLQPCKLQSGYLVVGLRKDNKRRTCKVHRIVAFTFIENDDPVNKTVVNHISEIKTQNDMWNLEWTTPKENTNYGTATERRAKKISKKVRCIETGEVFESAREAEHKTGTLHNSICSCCKGRYKTAGGFHWEYVD